MTCRVSFIFRVELGLYSPPWTKNEKEIILKIISNWPDVFQQWKGATLYRAVKSQFQNNPAASLPKANAIILYDSFFSHTNRPAVLTHELSHIYVLELEPNKLENILRLSGWERTVTNKPKWSGKSKPLKEDSPDCPSEDLANHIEDYLHSAQKLKNERPEVFKDLLGPDFKLKEIK